MPSIRLTMTVVNNGLKLASANGKPTLLWDADVKGFGVRCLPDGRASYLVKRRLGEGGRKAKIIWHVFGHSDTLALGDAREAAKGHLLAIAAGTHLNTERRTKRAVRAFNDDNTLKAVSDQYFERQKGNHSQRYWSEVQRLFKADIIPALQANRPVADIKKREIINLIEKKAATAPAVARFLFAALRPFFKWAVRREIITVNPMDGLEPPATARARDRVLSEAEVAELWKALQPKPKPTNDELRCFSYPFGPFYKLLLLTAQRRDEVAGMRWEELNLAKGEWVIPKERTKNSKSHLVHLSPEALAILQEIPRRNSPFVFTTTGEGPISGYSRAKARLDKLTPGIAPWRVHDLRRTAASGMAALGVQPFIVERVLNHVSGVTGGLVGVYQRHEYYDERKDALSDWASCVKAVAAGMLHKNLRWKKVA